jgi:hypothetical protein
LFEEWQNIYQEPFKVSVSQRHGAVIIADMKPMTGISDQNRFFLPTLH